MSEIHWLKHERALVFVWSKKLVMGALRTLLDIFEADTGRLGSAVRRGVVHVRRERTEE